MTYVAILTDKGRKEIEFICGDPHECEDLKMLWYRYQNCPVMRDFTQTTLSRPLRVSLYKK